MNFEMKPLACDPSRFPGLSEKLIVSHYENNYGGAVKRLNAIAAQLAAIDASTAPVFVLNGLNCRRARRTSCHCEAGDMQSPFSSLRARSQ